MGPAVLALETLDCVLKPGTGPCDSDNDGIRDVAELRAGTDPDGPGQLTECPQYGCGAKAEPAAQSPAQSRHGLPPVGAVASIAFLLCVRQLGRRRRS